RRAASRNRSSRRCLPPSTGSWTCSRAPSERPVPRRPLGQGSRIMNNPDKPTTPGATEKPEPAWNTGELRALLERGDVASFNRKRPRCRFDLAGIDLSGKDLRDVDLSFVNLDRALLRGSDLEGACFDGASLERADLTSASAARARFRQGCVLRYAN